MPDETPETPPTPTFTQADVDRVLADRLKRAETAHNKQLKALRDDLGIDDIADLHETIATLRDQAVKATQPAKPDKVIEAVAEVERRMQARIAKIETDNAMKLADVALKAKATLIDAEVRTLLARVGERITADAGPLLDNVLRQQLAVDEDTYRVIPVDTEGHPATDDKLKPLGTGDVIENLLKQYPSLVRANVSGGSGATPGGRVLPDKVASAMAAAKKDPTGRNMQAVMDGLMANAPVVGAAK
jgi:hypothetical protein